MLIQGYDIIEESIPHHVAIIMDGNGRWAKNRNKKRIIGHRKGVEVLIDILKIISKINIKVLSIFAFSSENWNRPKEEIIGLMNLFVEFFEKRFNEIKKENIKIIHSGLLNNLSEKVIKIIKKMTKDTINQNGPILNLVFNYGGRMEIVEASKKIANMVKDNRLSINDINEDRFSECLFHPEIKDPDLLIRTSGELRISNFLIWELAYSELWFTNTLWPDFTQKEFIQAIYEYQRRERRFGKVK